MQHTRNKTDMATAMNFYPLHTLEKSTLHFIPTLHSQLHFFHFSSFFSFLSQQYTNHINSTYLSKCPQSGKCPPLSIKRPPSLPFLYMFCTKNIKSDINQTGISIPGHEIAPNTGANATKFFTLTTKSWKLVAKLATRMFHHNLT